MSAGYGTPRRFTLAKMRGAFLSAARAYRVRDPIYRSELAALRTNSRIAALIIWFRTLIPTRVVANETNQWTGLWAGRKYLDSPTTKGDAAAPAFDLFAVNRD